MAVSVKFAEANKQIKINNNNTLCARDMLIIPRDIYYRLPCQSIQYRQDEGLLEKCTCYCWLWVVDVAEEPATVMVIVFTQLIGGAPI